MSATEIQLCECGCGQPAPISRDSDASRGYVKDQPRRFVHGHHRRITPPEGMRWCSSCQDFRPVGSFSPKAKAYCRVCANNKRQEWVERNPEKAKRHSQNQHLKRRYSITVDEYETLLDAQFGLCAICDNSPDGRVLVVDHNHETGEVRGLLCDACNVALGGFRDQPTLLYRGIEYLERRGHDQRLALA